MQGPVTSGENIRGKRAIPALVIIQGIAAIGGMMIKGVNALVDVKRASSFNNAIKLVNENVQITHDRLITLENRTAMMAKAIIPVLKVFKEKINSTNERLTRQYRMMIRAFQTDSQNISNTPFSIAHVQRLYHDTNWYTAKNPQYIRYKSALESDWNRKSEFWLPDTSYIRFSDFRKVSGSS